MTYKNRLVFLLSLIAALVLLYTGSLVFSPERTGARSMSFAWLDARLAERTTGIVITGPEGEVELLKQNNLWFVSHNGIYYPARQVRILDFLSVFTTRSSWPVRSSSASTHERFDLNENAIRLTVYEESAVLLDLLAGGDDVTGRESFFRRYGQDEVRSGDSTIKTYLTGPASNWFNLRLIPESEGGNIGVDSVQRLSVYNGADTQVFTRANRGWSISGISVENPDQSKIENYIRVILNTEGDGFADAGSEDMNSGRMVLEFGNGRVVTFNFGESDETGRKNARVSGSDLIYSIPSWAAGRLFIDSANLEQQ